MQLFEKKGEGRAGQGLGSERLGAGQPRAKGRAGCRAGRAQAGRRGRAQRTGRLAILRFSRPENLKNHVFATFSEERGREGRAGFGFRAFRGRAAQGQGRQGAGRVQGQRTEGRAGLPF